MSGTNWTDLTANTLAKAADVVMDLDWFQGTFTPNFEGDKTDGAYDLGESAYMWRDIFFRDTIYIGTTTTYTEYAGSGVVNTINSGTTISSIRGDGQIVQPKNMYLSANLNAVSSVTGFSTSHTLSSYTTPTSQGSPEFSSGVFVADHSGAYYFSHWVDWQYPFAAGATTGIITFNTTLFVNTTTNFINLGNKQLDGISPPGAGSEGQLGGQCAIILNSSDRVTFRFISTGLLSNKVDLAGGRINIFRI